MTVCEKCWEDAFTRSQADPSKSQTEHYFDLLKGRKERGEKKVKTNFYREGNLRNILAILASRFDDISSEECKVLSECFDILSQPEITLKDSIEVEMMCGKFGVLLSF